MLFACPVDLSRPAGRGSGDHPAWRSHATETLAVQSLKRREIAVVTRIAAGARSSERTLQTRAGSCDFHACPPRFRRLGRHAHPTSQSHGSNICSKWYPSIQPNTNKCRTCQSKCTGAMPPSLLNFRESDSSAPQVQSLAAGGSSQFESVDFSCDNPNYDFYDDISYIIFNSAVSRWARFMNYFS